MPHVGCHWRSTNERQWHPLSLVTRTTGPSIYEERVVKGRMQKQVSPWRKDSLRRRFRSMRPLAWLTLCVTCVSRVERFSAPEESQVVALHGVDPVQPIRKFVGEFHRFPKARLTHCSIKLQSSPASAEMRSGESLTSWDRIERTKRPSLINRSNRARVRERHHLRIISFISPAPL